MVKNNLDGQAGPNPFMVSLNYWNRIFQAYVLRRPSQLTFWHDNPQVHEAAFAARSDLLGPYYMPFANKADYNGPFDAAGVPLLQYHGKIGLQYNPIAIAQYGLGQVNRYMEGGEEAHLLKLRHAANYLVENFILNERQVPVWMHQFDFEYTEMLRKPWYSGLAQGQGISFLLRAYQLTRNSTYLEGADKAFRSFRKTLPAGGVLYRDEGGNTWIEEYITGKPTHILNGFIWALWGVYDYTIYAGDASVKELYQQLLYTLAANLQRYDTGAWSRYDLSDLKMVNLASLFYHRLHVVQLEVMFRLTGMEIFRATGTRWQAYLDNPLHRRRAWWKKALFKLRYF